MANNAPVKYGTSPVGRLIMGNPWVKEDKDQNQREIPLDKQKFFFGIAVEKNAPGVNEMLGNMQQAAAEGYASVPNVLAQVQMGLSATAYSWKVQDGDEMVLDQATNQQVLRNKHAAGCWIFKFSTTLPVTPAKYPPQSNTPVPCDPSEIKKGYFVQVSYSTTINGNMDHTAGNYLNPKTVCLVGFGQEIVSGPSLEQQFTGGHGGYTPAGMTATPQAPMGAPGAAPAPGMPPMGGQPAPGMMPQAGNAAPVPEMGAPAPGATTVPQPATPPAPSGMPQAGNPMTYGTGMPANNGQNGETTSPGNPPASYGGYMNPPQ